MKRLIALFLSIVMLLTGCGQVQPQSTSSSESDTVMEITESESEPIALEDVEPQFDSFSDATLLQYVEDNIYADLTEQFSSDAYTIEAVTASYISQEYLDEVSFNSQSNVFFGYTLAELDDSFQGARYVFTLGDGGQTVVREMQDIDDISTEELIENVAIGTGVILICVTVSYLTAGVGTPTVMNLIFTAAAKSATTFAISSGFFGGISAGIIKGYQTGDMKEALKAATLSGSNEFKWGAIAGAAVGGTSEAFSIFRSTRVTPTYRQSEMDVLNLTDDAVEQVSYLDGKKVSSTTLGCTRPDVVIENADGTVHAIEVKNYNLESSTNRNDLLSELRRQVAARIEHLPAGSTQEIILDVRGRGYSTRFLDDVVSWLHGGLDDLYPDIPIRVFRYLEIAG